jgi:hypothetical protein
MVDYALAFLVAYWIHILVVATVWSTGFSFSYGYIRGKKFFNTNYWGENKFAMFWSSFLFPLFWLFHGMWLLKDPFYAITQFLIRYSPFMLAYEFGLYISGGKEEEKK